VTTAIQFAVLGLGIGAVYALLGSGIVLIYRGSGTVNFAHGAFAMVGAYVFAELQSRGVNAWLAVLVATGAGAALGFVVQNPIMWLLQDGSPLARTIATLGVLISLQAAGNLRYSSATLLAKPFLPQHTWRIASVSVPSNRVILLGIAAVIAIGLAAAKRWSLIGLATSAAAESARGASILGWSPNLLASVNWMIGGALAGGAGALIAPLAGLQVSNLVLLVIPALAAGLLGRFSSFLGTLVGAVFIGIVQSESVRYVAQTGFQDTVPFLVIIAVLVVTGRSLPLRSHLAERLPTVGSGRIRLGWFGGAVALTLSLMLWVFPTNWQDAFTVSFSMAILLLSIVVLTGYAGQISLAQYGIAGIGAYVAGRLIATEGWPFLAAAPAGIVAAVLIGLIFALPALRTRGVTLAVVTLGLGFGLQRMLFENVNYSGSESGTQVGFLKIFGYDIDAIVHPLRYDIFVFILFVVAALAVVNLRRSAAGRRLIALRANERAAASLGISVIGGKLYAFAVASALAALSGIAIGFRFPSIIYPSFSALQSVFAVGLAVLGGVGYLVGPVLGSVLATGGIGSLLDPLLHGIDNYLTLIGGIALIFILVSDPNGLVSLNLSAARAEIKSKAAYFRLEVLLILLLRRVTVRMRKRVAGYSARSPRERLTKATGQLHVSPKSLEVDRLAVRYGGVVAVNDVSLRVSPGEIVGLIGPNGAGKTTLIDAVTGFTQPAQGAIRVGGVDLTRRPAHSRVQLGVARSWQSLELFESTTVFENIQVASDDWNWVAGARALVLPARPRLNAVASAAVAEFELDHDLDRLTTDMPYGRRRLVGIARAVALNPSVLLLDEPAAGLSATESIELGKLVQKLAREWGMAVLLVEHDIDLVLEICDRIVVLDFGRHIAEGTPDEIRNDAAVIAAYLGDATKAGGPAQRSSHS